jgi:hypothetical protein
MKALLKFFLLLALIVGGKLAKQATPITVAEAPVNSTEQAASIVLVHQVLTSEPVVPADEQPQQGSSVVTEMF